MNDVKTDVLRKELRLRCSPQRAFEMFTARAETWWPLHTHSCSGDPGAKLRFPNGAGETILEVAPDGTEHVWGTVTSWDPPRSFRCTWHPGTEPSTATDLEVTFEADGDGTRFVLVHSGWAGKPEIRSNYDAGWDRVLALFEAAAPE